MQVRIYRRQSDLTPIMKALQMVNFQIVQKASVMQFILAEKVRTITEIFMKVKTEHQADLTDLKVGIINHK